MNLSFLKVMCIIILIFSLILPVNAELRGDMQILWNNAQTSNINLGSLSADNTTTTWPATLNPRTGFVIQRIDNNVAADLYVRVNGDFNDGSGNTISYDNFKYSNYGVNVPITSFTTTSTLVRANWRRTGSTNCFIPVFLYLTVPYGTEPGIYTITVIHTLVRRGTLPPLIDFLEVTDGNDTFNQTDNETKETNDSIQNMNITL